MPRTMSSKGWTGGGTDQSIIFTAPGTSDHPTVPSFNAHNNLLSFLTVLQLHKVDLVPMIWYSDTTQAGFGATSSIRQLEVERETGFTFKPTSMKDAFGFESEEATFNALVSELSVLAHPSLRYSYGIVDLIGVCWDFSPERKEIRPALILERAKYGNLHKFLNTKLGRQTAFADRLDFCVSIASAILAMHSYNFIHGDIKPHNILVFATRSDETYVKLADFGFAGWAADSDKTIINLPKSVPWNAPEHHHRGFTISEAKLMDLYSLALTCLWILFKDTSINDDMKVSKHHPLITKGNPKLEELFQSWESLELLKRSDEFRDLAYELVQGAPLTQSQQNGLISFFNSALALRPEHRSFNIGSLDPSLSEQWILGPQQDGPYSEVNHANLEFQIGPIIGRLLTAEISLKRKLLALLEEQSTSHINASVRQNAAFQLAICSKVGFGAAADEAEVLKWLYLSQKSREDLACELALIKESLNTSMMQNGSLNMFLMKGLIREELPKRSSAISADMEDYEAIWKTEISDLRSAFGGVAKALVPMRRRLLELFLEEQRYDEAKEVIKDSMEDFRSWREVDLDAYIEHARRVEEPQWRRGTLPRLSLPRFPLPDLKARSLELQTFTNLASEKVEESIATLDTLADIYEKQHRLEEVAWLIIWSLEWWVKYLGETHRATLKRLARLGRVFISMDRLKDAEKLLSYASTIAEHTLGLEHRDTLANYGWLAQIYRMQDNHFESQSILVRIMKILDKTLTQTSPETRFVKMTLGCVYINQRRFNEAADILQRTYEDCRAHVGDEHGDTITTLDLLTDAYTRTSQLGKAKELCQRGLPIVERTLGTENLKYISLEQTQAKVYLHLDRLAEARELAYRNWKRAKTVTGVTNLQVGQSALVLTETLQKLGQYDEEKVVIEEHMQRLEETDDQTHVANSRRFRFWMDKRGQCLWRQGRYSHAFPDLFFSYDEGHAARVWWGNHLHVAPVPRFLWLTVVGIQFLGKVWLGRTKRWMSSSIFRRWIGGAQDSERKQEHIPEEDKRTNGSGSRNFQFNGI